MISEEESREESAGETGADFLERAQLADAGDSEAPESAEASIDVSDGAEPSIQETGAFLKGLIEALLFVADHPLELKEIARGARIDRARAQELLDELRKEYEARGLRIDEVAGGFSFRSSPTYAERVRQYLSLRPVRLSRAQLETLAIVAYRQPITRPEIDDIRGVDAGPVLKGLLERDLVRIIGKKDEPGRPMLYGTTPSFLEAFSLKSLRDLPTLREYTELSEESRQTFESELGEAAPEGPISVAPAASGVVSPESAVEPAAEGEEAASKPETGGELAAEAGETTEENEEADEPGQNGNQGADEDPDGDDDDDDEDGDDEDDDDDDEDDDDDDDDDDDENEDDGEAEKGDADADDKQEKAPEPGAKKRKR
jgi:segregation and condensation protein B